MIHITRVMFNIYDITDRDFMGYSVDKNNASFHHLIIPRRNGGPKTVKNGAILNNQSSHPYIHLIELKDYDIFFRITREMIKENRLGKLDKDLIKKIHDLLNVFEREHSGDHNISGEPIIKEEYTKRLIR